MTKQVMTNKAREKYTGLDYKTLITMPAEPKEITQTTENRAEQAVTPEGYKLNPAYIEKRTRRVQIVLQPSLYKKIEAHYKELGYKSFNDYINSILEEELNTRR